MEKREIHYLTLHCGKNQKFTLIEKIFHQITYLVISLVKLLLSRNFCQKCVRVNSRNFHTVHTYLCTSIISTYEYKNKKISSQNIFSVRENFISRFPTTWKFGNFPATNILREMQTFCSLSELKRNKIKKKFRPVFDTFDFY